jgi:hypothetical protein
MRSTFLAILSFLFAQQMVYAQRATRSFKAPTAIYQPTIFESRYFAVTLTNTDTVSILLKLGPFRRIENGDTLNLARTYPCNSPTVGQYYDLHDLVDQEDNCVRWYTLQQLKPKDTLRFMVRLKDFDNSDTSRFYCCYTKKIKKVDRELNLYTEPKKIYIMKESRDFKTNYVVIGKNALNTGFTKVGLNIYLSAANQ